MLSGAGINSFRCRACLGTENGEANRANIVPVRWLEMDGSVRRDGSSRKVWKPCLGFHFLRGRRQIH